MDYSPPGFSVHGIFQARTLDWIAISFSRDSSWPRDLLGRQILYHGTTWEAPVTSITMGLWSNIYMDDTSKLIFLFVANPKGQNHSKRKNIYTSDHSFALCWWSMLCWKWIEVLHYFCIAVCSLVTSVNICFIYVVLLCWVNEYLQMLYPLVRLMPL